MPNTVQVIPSDGKFTVRVVENGEIFEKHFEIEEHARAYASGQRTRLCLLQRDHDQVIA